MYMCSFYTSSTAQGSGGNFKDSKPIGEVYSCDAWIAEQTPGPKGGFGVVVAVISTTAGGCSGVAQL